MSDKTEMYSMLLSKSGKVQISQLFTSFQCSITRVKVSEVKFKGERICARVRACLHCEFISLHAQVRCNSLFC